MQQYFFRVFMELDEIAGRDKGKRVDALVGLIGDAVWLCISTRKRLSRALPEDVVVRARKVHELLGMWLEAEDIKAKGG